MTDPVKPPWRITPPAQTFVTIMALGVAESFLRHRPFWTQLIAAVAVGIVVTGSVALYTRWRNRP